MQAHALPPKKKWWRKERRVPITISELELAISESVTKAGCEDFVGVIVRHRTPKSHLDPNWAITGVKFGKAEAGQRSSGDRHRTHAARVSA
jgi:hypothetical protein